MSAEYALLAMLADGLDDIENARMAAANRLRILTRDGADSDGEERGFGLLPDAPPVLAQQAVLDGLAEIEHRTILDLQRALRKHPLGPWVKAQVGIGEKQGARLIAAVGDPYWNTLHDRPRTVSELWAYCGLHVLPAGQRSNDAQGDDAGGATSSDPATSSDATPKSFPSQGRSKLPNEASGAPSPMAHSPRSGSTSAGGDAHASPDAHLASGVAPRRTKGQRANWSTAAKTKAYLCAESCIKQAHSPYRHVYDLGRKKYEDATHGAPCARCGPKGKPAEVGSPLSAGHQHARAMRLVSKEILKELWRESRRLHGDDQEGA